jgi:hypothetical protein
MMLDPGALARALGGSVSGHNVIVTGPGHSRADRSLSLKIDPTAPDGFVVHSFAGDPAIVYRDYLRAALALGPRERRRRQASRWKSRPGNILRDDLSADRSSFALRLWHQAQSAVEPRPPPGPKGEARRSAWRARRASRSRDQEKPLTHEGGPNARKVHHASR